MVGLLLSITDYEYTFQRMLLAFPPANDPNILQPDRERIADEFAIERLAYSKSGFERVVVMFISLFGLFTLAIRHANKADWINKDLP